MPVLAFWMPGPWELIILAGCCLSFLLALAAGIGLAVYLARRKKSGQPPAGQTPPGGPPKTDPFTRP